MPIDMVRELVPWDMEELKPFKPDYLSGFKTERYAVALEEGFEVHTRKTRIMRRSVAQRAVGLVLNSHLNVSRDSFDRLKAILHNCVVHGPDGQNRDGVADFSPGRPDRACGDDKSHPWQTTAGEVPANRLGRASGGLNQRWRKEGRRKNAE